MNTRERIRIAIQKSGRLHEKSMNLLERCGLDFEWSKDRLFSECKDFPLDVMLVRDDDIPEYILDDICELGIVGQNILKEKLLARGNGSQEKIVCLKELGFGTCRLSIAIPRDQAYQDISSYAGKRIATSYPFTLRQFLKEKGVDVKVIELKGSVEIAPTLKIADAICDLVSTGSTLRSNGLKEVETIFESQAILIQTQQRLSGERKETLARFVQRLQGVLKADQTKYIMMNAPRSALPAIRNILPGMEEPSVIPLSGDGERVAIHAVARENVFWETMEKLKRAGASSILVIPIEKIIE